MLKTSRNRASLGRILSSPGMVAFARQTEVSMSITLYYWPRSSATRVQWCLEELGLAYEKKRVEREYLRTPEFRAINPEGRIPALVDGDARLFESLAIILYLGEKYGADKGVWPAAGSADRAEAITWTVWGTIQLNHYIH